MNRETRNKFASSTDQSNLTGGNACWQTPPAVFAKLDADFGPFDIDVCADEERALCPLWFGADSPVNEYDARTARWAGWGMNGFCNPPYGRFVQDILAKARQEAALGFATTLLLPLRITGAFKRYVLSDGGASDLLFCDKRITFYDHGTPRLDAKGNPCSAMFDSVIVRYVPDHGGLTRTGIWTVPPHVVRSARRKKAA